MTNLGAADALSGSHSERSEESLFPSLCQREIKREPSGKDRPQDDMGWFCLDKVNATAGQDRCRFPVI
jgi:hypothetical protein